MAVLPMFPLGSPLLPHMPLPLRVFEPRYLALLAAILPDDRPRFGIVLIERGREVGGDDVRFSIGTLAEIVEVHADDASVLILVRGTSRIAVTRWLDDDPYPRAEVVELPPFSATDADADALAATEQAVRSALAEATEFADLPWAADLELDDDPVHRAWQLAGIAPVGELDRHELLASSDLRTLLDETRRRTEDALEMLRFRADVDTDDEAGAPDPADRGPDRASDSAEDDGPDPDPGPGAADDDPDPHPDEGDPDDPGASR